VTDFSGERDVQDRLDSWKEIAAYLGRSKTTVQRWEQELGLPVRRLPGANRSSVFAFKPEVDEWRRSGAEQRDQRTVTERTDGGQSTKAAAGALVRAHDRWRMPDGLAKLRNVGAGIGAVAVLYLAATRLLIGLPAAPRDLAISSPRLGSVIVEWKDASTNESRFEVARFGQVFGAARRDMTTLRFDGLDAGTSYHWDVRACNLAGCSSWHGVRGKTPDGAEAANPLPLPGGPTDIVFSSGRMGANRQIFVTNAIGSSPVWITKSKANDTRPAWSPDRRRIAFVSDETGRNEIFLVNVDGTNRRNITNRDPAHDEDPAWSPDGRRIAFTSTRSGNADIWVMNEDGSEPTQLTTSAAIDAQPAWSRDGRRIAFISTRAGRNELFIMNADGGSVQQMTADAVDAGYPAWSPDDRRIAFSSFKDGNYEVYVVDANGHNQRNLSHHPSYDWPGGWSPDGNRLVFLTNRDRNLEIYTMAADGSDPVNITSIRGDDGDPDWGLGSPGIAQWLPSRKQHAILTCLGFCGPADR
jgi:WD40 repeat protein/predicted DNA-binding transcriptional regulator AlpA